MEIIPIEYCDICEDYIHLNQKQLECAFEHQCDSAAMECPLKRFFSKNPNDAPEKVEQIYDMPSFYIADL